MTGGSVGQAIAQHGDWPLTVAEQSEFRATSRSEQVVEFIDRVAARASHVRRIDFGKTVEGRPLVSAVVAQPPVHEPFKLTDDDRLVVMLVGNIHAGECDGKEALLMLLRELAQQPEHPWLKDLVLVFVPNFNADGNDRMRKDNRPGQVGPEEGMGERANAQGLDLNRDFVKLDTPECQSLVALMNQWDPHLLIDTHTTNGSRHRYTLTYDVPHNCASPAPVRTFLRQELMPDVTRRLESQHILSYYYGNFNRDYTQWVSYGDEPRYGIEYVGLRGRMAILAESYAYATYEQRIVAVREFVRACLDGTLSRARVIRQLLHDARQQAVHAAGDSAADNTVPIQSEMVAVKEKVVIKGFQRETSADGGRITTQEPQDYTVDFLTQFQPTLTVQRPYAYVLPATASTLAQRLQRHGVSLQRLTRDVELDLELYWIKSLQRSDRKYQGHFATHATVELRKERRTVQQGTVVVVLDSPLSHLIIQLLEPQASDGFLAWDLCEPALTADSEYPVWRVPAHVELPLGNDE